MPTNDDYFKKQSVPEWAEIHGLKHFSPSQASIPDDVWLAKYFVATREENNAWAYNPNVIFGNLIHDAIRDVARKNKTNKEACDEVITRLDAYMPTKISDEQNEKEKMIVERMKEVAINYIDNAVGVLNAIKPLKKMQFMKEKSRSLELPRLEIPILMFTDIEYDDQGVELKIKCPSFRGFRKDGKPSYASAPMPSKPTIEHLRQVACYWYTSKKLFRIMYVNEREAKVFDSTNCKYMSEENLLLAVRYLRRTFLRRQKLLQMFKTLEDIATMLPCDFSSFYWNGCPKRVLSKAREVFKVSEELD